MAQLVLQAHLSAVPTARHWVSRQVARCAEGIRGVVEEDLVELLTSEAVTNAVRHGAGPVTVAVRCTQEYVCVAVTDTSPVQPVVRHGGAGATGGRGMARIDQLATRWGLKAQTPPAEGA